MSKNAHNSYQICVSGAARGASVQEGKELARQLGIAIAAGGHSLMSGATIGLPNYAAEAYKAAGGKMSVGISPAASKVEHVMKYRLPTEAYDTILYTGLRYEGRDALLIHSSDAVVSIGGRLGTLHEFTIAMEAEKPIGFLQGAGGISSQIPQLLELGRPLHNPAVFFNEDATALIADIVKHLDQEFAAYPGVYTAS
jgi:uncharacterized protein (TIGR00725 family)